MIIRKARLRIKRKIKMVIQVIARISQRKLFRLLIRAIERNHSRRKNTRIPIYQIQMILISAMKRKSTIKAMMEGMRKKTRMKASREKTRVMMVVTNRKEVVRNCSKRVSHLRAQFRMVCPLKSMKWWIKEWWKTRVAILRRQRVNSSFSLIRRSKIRRKMLG